MTLPSTINRELANANTPEPNPNIPPNPNEGVLRWDDGFITADHESLIQPNTTRYEVLVPKETAQTLQTAVKKTVAILLANSDITILPHVQNTSRNPVNNEKNFPIERVAMKDYIFDVGSEYHNGRPFFKASFLVESTRTLSKIKTGRLLDILREKRIFVQEYNSTKVYDSKEVGFLCNLHPNFVAKEHIISEFKQYVKEVTNEDVNMKLKLTNRFFGNKKNGSVRSQYLALYIDSSYFKEAGEIIGEALEKGKILYNWKNVRLLPSKPSLHESYNKEKFFQILQIHNKAVRDTTRVTLKKHVGR